MISKKLKTAWIKALRGRGYKQATGMLQSSTDRRAYCCLGVLCRVAQRTTGYEPNLESYGTLAGAYLSDQDSFGVNITHETNLIGMNDDEFKSFKEIADYIQKNIEAV